MIEVTMIRKGMKVFLEGRAISNQDPDGWIDVTLTGTDIPIRVHRSHIVYTDPKPFQLDDLVRSTIEGRETATGVVKGIDGDKVWVRWDSGLHSSESAFQLEPLTS